MKELARTQGSDTLGPNNQILDWSYNTAPIKNVIIRPYSNVLGYDVKQKIGKMGRHNCECWCLNCTCMLNSSNLDPCFCCFMNHP